MELQFPKSAFDYLNRVLWEIKNDEQTQEVRLADSFPDIGKIISAWGQPLIRSKEWLGSSMRISGGVMAWILYMPEEDGTPRCVETWIPFQLHWDFPQTQHDGTIRVCCLMKGIDARSISARKMMVRSLVSVAAEALEPVRGDVYQPGTVPEDVQILKKSYPICLPTEAGESVITIDEELTPNISGGQIRRIIRCSADLELSDQKVMTDKVVFRGNAVAHLLCQSEEGEIKHYDFDLPFSQYVQLERDHDSYAIVDVMPALTNLELDMLENGALRLKAGIVGQYVIYDRPVFEIVADAYSTRRPMELRQQKLQLPAILDMCRETVKAESAVEELQPIDVAMYTGHPQQFKEQEKIRLEIPFHFQATGYGDEGDLRGSTVRMEKELDIPADEKAGLLVRSTLKEKNHTSGSVFGCEMTLDMLVTGPTDIPMVTALEIGEESPQKEPKPSLILRRLGEDTLWDVAKTCGSTVEAIEEANGLTEVPPSDQLLLIPVS